MMKILKQNKYRLIVLVISLLPLLPLLRPGMFWAHDSESHVVRVAEFYKSLTEGNIIPRWAGGLNAGYGHPVLMFLYPLANYLASLFHFLGANFVGSVKLTLATGYIGAGVFMYLWLRRHFSPPAALIGTAIWQLAPYRFVNLYVRNAMGENTAFLFVPLCLLSFHALITKPSVAKISLSALTLAGLILSHNAVSLMFLPFLCLYALILLYFSKAKPLAISYWLLAILMAFGASAFFWIPAIVEAKYTLRDIVMNGDTFAVHFPTFKQLIIPHWGYGNSVPGDNDDLSFQIGIFQWLAALVGGVIILKNWRQTSLITRWLGILLGLTMFISGTFLLLKFSLPLWHLIPLIKKFQFPWRFLIVPIFASSILAATAFQIILNTTSRKKFTITLISITIIIAGLVFQNYPYWRPRGDYLPSEDQVINEYLGTTDTGESTPLWAVRFQEKRADNTIGIVWGAPIDYTVIKRESEVHEYTITTKVKTQIAENTLYFPGWTVYVDGQKTGIIWTDASWRGVITYPVPVGTHHVRVVFEETKIRQISDIISIVSLAIISLFIITPHIRKKKHIYA